MRECCLIDGLFTSGSDPSEWQREHHQNGHSSEERFYSSYRWRFNSISHPTHTSPPVRRLHVSWRAGKLSRFLWLVMTIFITLHNYMRYKIMNATLDRLKPRGAPSFKIY